VEPRSTDIEDAEWWELSAAPEPALREQAQLPARTPAAIRARAHLAQAIALRDMELSWHSTVRVISGLSPRMCVAGRPPSPRWLASCGSSRSQRARAAETVALDDFLTRPARPYPPLRSI